MAEALNSSPNLFFCHRCAIEIIPHLPEYTCPQCHGGFIEPSEGNSSSSSSNASLSSFTEPSQSNAQDYDSLEESEPLFPQLDPFGELLFRTSVHLGNRDGAGPSTSSGARRPHRSGTSTLSFPANPLTRMRGPSRYLVLAPMLQDLIVQISGGDELYGNPGDYVFGRHGLDAIISQLLGQLDSTGPPPLDQTQINAIPTVTVTEDICKDNVQCSVCMEDLMLNESVRKLQCGHLYHDNCITPWLKMHATCPVCRTTLADASGQQQLSSSGAGNSSSPAFTAGGSADTHSGTRVTLSSNSENGTTVLHLISNSSDSDLPDNLELD